MTDYHKEERMPMKNPPHPGSIVRQDCIEPLGLTIPRLRERWAFRVRR